MTPRRSAAGWSGRTGAVAFALVVVTLGGCSDGDDPDAAVTTTTVTSGGTTTTTDETTTTADSTTSTSTSTTAPPSSAPPTTAGSGGGSGPTRPDGPPSTIPVTVAPPTTRGPHPVGDARVVCSGPSGGPYAVNVTWPFSDGVAETASGSFAAYGTYTLAGTRAGRFTVSVGPALNTSGPHCVFLSITGPA